ncbi:MAG: response regulator [Candidatus Pacearchaeota archaeon]
MKRSDVRVLVVDDNNIVRESITDLLSDYGYQHIGEAADGLEATEQAENYDLILIDTEMPLLCGPNACAQIRSLYPEHNVCIVGMSSTSLNKENWDGKGSDKFVSKMELGSKGVLKTIEDVLAKRVGAID